MTRQLMKANWKKRRLHLAGQDRAQTSTRSFVTQDPDQILAVVGRGKKRQTLNVIPVRVCNEKGQLDRSRSQLLFQRQTEGTNPSARVEHDNFAVGPHFYTTGVASIPDRRRPRYRSEPRTPHNFIRGGTEPSSSGEVIARGRCGIRR